MIFEIDKETINFLCKKKITFSQFCICLLIYKKDYASIYKYTDNIGFVGNVLIPYKNEEGEIEHKKEIDDLIERGFLKNNNRKGEYDLDYFEITTKFTKGFLDEYKRIATELFNIYPKHIRTNNGELFEAKAIDFDEFQDKYLKAIDGSISLHNDVVKPHVDKMKKENSGYARMKIMNYIGSKNWNDDIKVNVPKQRIY